MTPQVGFSWCRSLTSGGPSGRVQLVLESEFLDREGELPAELATKLAICRLVFEIDQAGQAMGKDDKFQVWLLIAVR